MINYSEIVKKALGIKSIEFDDLKAGNYYLLFDISNPFKPKKRFARIIHLRRNGSDAIESMTGSQPVGMLQKGEIGIWYSIYNLDESRNRLVPVQFKRNYEFSHQLDYELHWIAVDISNDINTLA